MGPVGRRCYSMVICSLSSSKISLAEHYPLRIDDGGAVVIIAGREEGGVGKRFFSFDRHDISGRLRAVRIVDVPAADALSVSCNAVFVLKRIFLKGESAKKRATHLCELPVNHCRKGTVVSRCPIHTRAIAWEVIKRTWFGYASSNDIPC